jgi:hypothetical protein
MGDFDTEPSAMISLADARSLIDGSAARGPARAARWFYPRRLLRLLVRDPKYPAALLLGAWLALPRDSGVGLACLLGGVAWGKMAFDKWKARRRRR